MSTLYGGAARRRPAPRVSLTRVPLEVGSLALSAAVGVLGGAELCVRGWWVRVLCGNGGTPAPQSISERKQGARAGGGKWVAALRSKMATGAEGRIGAQRSNCARLRAAAGGGMHRSLHHWRKKGREHVCTGESPKREQRNGCMGAGEPRRGLASPGSICARGEERLLVADVPVALPPRAILRGILLIVLVAGRRPVLSVPHRVNRAAPLPRA